jgi:hypothetical protein
MTFIEGKIISDQTNNPPSSANEMVRADVYLRHPIFSSGAHYCLNLAIDCKGNLLIKRNDQYVPL